ncbi:MAG: hypothetical protein ABSE36_19770 [Terracidiphilus sp.]|jgi:hypothetical protein
MNLWETVEYIGETLVTVGVVGEVFAEWRDPHRRRLGRVSSLVLIGGLALSLAALVGTNEHFNVTIADLNLRASQANERAATADRKRAELENGIANIFGPRRLTATQSAAIVKRLAGLDGVKVDVYVVDPGNAYTSSDDSIGFGRDIVSTLLAANMNAEGWLMKSCLSGVEVRSTSVITLPDSVQYRNALRILNAFRPEVGMASGVGHAIPLCTNVAPLDKDYAHKRWEGANNDTIAIAIGTKIQPILTREMLEPTQSQP